MPRQKDNIIWRDDIPPNRGPYKTKSATGKNPGWRYWDGTDWGISCSSRAFCLEVRKLGSRKSSRHLGVLWADVAKPLWVIEDRGTEVMICHRTHGFTTLSKDTFDKSLNIRLLVSLAEEILERKIKL